MSQRKTNFICPRCGVKHEMLEVNDLTKWSNPRPDITYNRWAICPTTNEPMLIEAVPSDFIALAR